MSKKRRRVFNVETKCLIISRLKKGETNSQLAREYGTSHSTISTIWKEREKVETLFHNNFLKMKRARSSNHAEIEEALLEWFKDQSANNALVTGPVLQQKANEIARLLGDKGNFVCSPSWIQRFRARHSISGKSKFDETAIVSKPVVDECLFKKWQTLCDGYEPDEIFHAEETGLYYSMTLNEALKLKVNQNSNREITKYRLTIMVVTNVTGTTKKKLLAIGNIQKPDWLKTSSSLPVTYECSPESRLTPEIFQEWIRSWDAELKLQEKNILLILDNCSICHVFADLQHIKLVSLPLDLRPKERGLISCLKTHYRTVQLLKMMENIDSSKVNASTTLFDAILMLSEAWEKIQPKTIYNCLKDPGTKIEDEPSYVSLVRLARIFKPDISHSQINDFIHIDASITDHAPHSKSDSASDIRNPNEDLQETKEHVAAEILNGEQFKVPSLNDGLEAIGILQKIILANDQFQGSNFGQTLVKLQRKLETAYTRLKCPENRGNGK